VDVSAIGHIVALVGLPYSLKVVWAPLVDRAGTRKQWIIATQLLIAALCVSLVAHGGTGIDAMITAALVGIAALSATQDIAADAYSIEVLSERERGPANGTRVTAYRLALIAAGGLLVAAAGYVGWRPVFLAAAAVMAALALLTGTMASTRRIGAQETRPFLGSPLLGAVWWAIWDPLLDLLSRPYAWAMLAFVLLFKIGDFALLAMIKPFWVDSHYSTQEIGWIQGTVGMIATIVGALVGGALVSRLGTFRALLVLGVAQATASLTYWVVAMAGAPRPGMWSASVIEHFTGGLGTAAFLTYLMSVCDKRYAATQFALLTALYGWSRSIGGFGAGDIVEAVGYANFFLLTFVFAVPAWLLLPLIRRTVAPAAARPA
jgi:PAT family beta-lactamase induction signal transducer AmpG